MAAFEITIAGEINLDLIFYGLPESLPVGREVLAADFRLTLGSSSAILAHNLASLGVRVGFITRLGSDPLGAIALELLGKSGVDLSRVVRAAGGAQTGVTVQLPHGGARRVLTYPGSMFEMSRADLDFEYLASARHFHLSSLFLHRRLQPDLPEIFRRLKQRGLTISLDTNDDPEDRWDGALDALLPYVDILLPNEDEARRMTRSRSVEDALDALAPRIPLVAVKCGSGGAIVQQGGERIRVAALSVAPVDTVGAGDSFNAGFLSAWLRGADAKTCALAGNVAGALSTTMPGGIEAFRDRSYREAFLRKNGFPLVTAGLRDDG